MTLLLPTSSSPLNNPDHAFLHRVVAVDSASPEQSIIVDSSGRVGIATTAPNYSLEVVNPSAGTTERLLAVTNANTPASASYIKTIGLGVGNGTSDALGYGFLWGQKGNGTYTIFMDFTAFAANFRVPLFLNNTQFVQSATTLGQTVPLLGITAGNVIQIGMNYPAADPVEIYTGSTATNITFKEKTTATTLATITGDGKLGIGSITPTDALDINGNAIRIRTSKTPSSSGDTGNAGEICWDSNYIYVCIATNTWVRTALTTW